MGGPARLAASLAVDRQALNQAETLGLSRPTGSIVPRDFEFALPLDAPPFDPKRARQLLAEAGFPNGFDGGEITPFPPYNSMGEAIAGWLQAVGIRTRMRTMERGAFMSSWREKTTLRLVPLLLLAKGPRPRGVLAGGEGSRCEAAPEGSPRGVAARVGSAGPSGPRRRKIGAAVSARVAGHATKQMGPYPPARTR